MRSRKTTVLTLVAMGVVLAPSALAQTNPTTSNAPEACLDAHAISVALQCPTASIRHPDQPVRLAPPATRAPHASAAPNDHPEAGFHVDPAQLHGRTPVQVSNLAEREAQLLEQLIASMRTNDPQRPNALVRLASVLDALSRMERSAARNLDAPIFEARRAHDDARARELVQRQRALLDAQRAHRDRMIRAYERLVTDHPQYARMDEVLFSLAFAYDESGRSNDARRTYLTLIQRFPTSPYVPHAYVAFADFFFDQNQFAEAAQFYDRVIADRSPENALRAYALYRRAWAEFNLQQFDESLANFFGVIDEARAHPEAPMASSLARTARSELVSAYGAIYGVSRPLRPSDALHTFRRYAADDGDAFAMFERLGELYQDHGQWPNSIAVFHALMSERPDDDRVCVWQSQVARAVVASRPRPEQLIELQRMLDLYERLRTATPARNASATRTCRDASARIVFDVASHWHLEALGLGTNGAAQTTGTRNAVTMDNAAHLYTILLERFPDLADVTFPDYDRADWPTPYRIAYYRAELVRARGDVCTCGAAYDHVVDMNPSGELTEDAAYKAVLCYSACIAQHPTARQDLTSTATMQNLAPRAFTPDENAMARAFTRYICFAGDVANHAASTATDLLTIRYRRAYLYYAANHFDEAVALFREVALTSADVPDPEGLRTYAADLLLDSLNVLHVRNPSRAMACLDRMDDEIGHLRGPYCAIREPSPICARFDTLVAATEEARIVELHRQHRFLEACAGYVHLAREHPNASNVDEWLWNASVECEAAHRLGRAMRIREVVLQRFPDGHTPSVQRALHRLAQNYHAIQVFSRAAELYEQYAAYVNADRARAMAAETDAVDQAADGLRTATIFRIGLGQETEALQDAARFATYFGNDPGRRRTAAAVVFSIGQIYQDRAARAASARDAESAERARRAWSDVVAHYTQFIDRYARHGTVDQQIMGSVALGRAYWHLGDFAHAELYLRAAATLWGDGESSAGESRIREQLGGDADDAVERSRDAVAEARFYLAERTFERVRDRRPPAYHGPGTVASFRRWEAGTQRHFFELQRHDIEQLALQSYRPLIDMHVPNWEIAASEHAADLYSRMATAINEAPEPPDVRANPDLEAIWIRERDRWARIFRDEAVRGYEHCIGRATHVHWFNEWSQRCERGLNDIDRRRFPLADELRPAADQVYSRASNARPVERIESESEL